jgi:hypothetical protein
MDKLKQAIELIGSGIAIGIVVAIFLIFGLKIEPKEIEIFGVIFPLDPPTPTPSPLIVEFDGGLWSASISEPHVYRTNILTSDTLTDFVAEVDVRIDDDSPEFHGLIFRRQDDKSFYSFRISAKGEFAFDVWESDDTNYRRLIGPAVSRAIRTGVGQKNHLRVVAKGNRFEMFVNDTKVIDSFVDSTFDVGAVGCMACTCDGSSVAEVEFSNISVRRID